MRLHQNQFCQNSQSHITNKIILNHVKSSKREVAEKLVIGLTYELLLIFLQQSIAKDKDTVIKVCALFFAKNAIKLAVDMQSCSKGWHTWQENKITSNIIVLLDIFQLLCSLKEKEDLLLLAIPDPSDMSSFPMYPLTIVASRLNKRVLRLSFFSKKLWVCLQSSNPVIWPLTAACQSPSDPVVLLNIPCSINLQNPTNQHNFVKNLAVLTRRNILLGAKMDW